MRGGASRRRSRSPRTPATALRAGRASASTAPTARCSAWRPRPRSTPRCSWAACHPTPGASSTTTKVGIRCSTASSAVNTCPPPPSSPSRRSPAWSTASIRRPCPPPAPDGGPAWARRGARNAGSSRATGCAISRRASATRATWSLRSGQELLLRRGQPRGPAGDVSALGPGIEDRDRPSLRGGGPRARLGVEGGVPQGLERRSARVERRRHDQHRHRAGRYPRHAPSDGRRVLRPCDGRGRVDAPCPAVRRRARRRGGTRTHTSPRSASRPRSRRRARWMSCIAAFTR